MLGMLASCASSRIAAVASPTRSASYGRPLTTTTAARWALLEPSARPLGQSGSPGRSTFCCPLPSRSSQPVATSASTSGWHAEPGSPAILDIRQSIPRARSLPQSPQRASRHTKPPEYTLYRIRCSTVAPSRYRTGPSWLSIDCSRRRSEVRLVWRSAVVQLLFELIELLFRQWVDVRVVELLVQVLGQKYMRAFHIRAETRSDQRTSV